jgi:hypothetical protein
LILLKWKIEGKNDTLKWIDFEDILDKRYIGNVDNFDNE